MTDSLDEAADAVKAFLRATGKHLAEHTQRGEAMIKDIFRSPNAPKFHSGNVVKLNKDRDQYNGRDLDASVVYTVKSVEEIKIFDEFFYLLSWWQANTTGGKSQYVLRISESHLDLAPEGTKAEAP